MEIGVCVHLIMFLVCRVHKASHFDFLADCVAQGSKI